MHSFVEKVETSLCMTNRKHTQTTKHAKQLFVSGKQNMTESKVRHEILVVFQKQRNVTFLVNCNSF